MSVDSLRAPTETLPRPTLPQRPQLAGRLAQARIAGWWVAAAVVALTLASFLLRSGALNFHYWIDEGISVGIASHPLRELPSLLRQDGSPPLYYLLLHFWMRAWGRGEVATHSLSLVFALLAVPVSYWAGHSLFGRRTGIFCAVLAAGLPFLSTYAQETRMYSLLLLLSIVAAACFVHVFVFRRRRYLPLFVASLTAVLYTHNWGLFLGLTAFGAYLICVWQASADRRALLRDGALAFGLVAVLYAPWLPTLLYQARHTGAPWALPPVLWSLPQGLYFLVGGRGAAMALLFGGSTGLLALRARRPEERSLLMAAVSLAMLGLGTLLIAWLYAKVTPSWAVRYLAVLAGPMLLLTGLGLARSSRLGLAALILVSCFWVLDPTPKSLDSKSNVGAAAKAIRAGDEHEHPGPVHPARAGPGARVLPAAGEPFRHAPRIRAGPAGGRLARRPGALQEVLGSVGARPPGSVAPSRAARRPRRPDPIRQGAGLDDAGRARLADLDVVPGGGSAAQAARACGPARRRFWLARADLAVRGRARVRRLTPARSIQT